MEERSIGTVSALKILGYRGSCLSRCRCDELPCPLLNWLGKELRRVAPELQASESTGDVLLVGELRNLLSEMSSPLVALTSDVLEPSTLCKVTDFLVSELQAAHLLQQKEVPRDEPTPREECVKEQRLEDFSHDVAEDCQEYKDDNRTALEMEAEWTLLLHALDLNASSQFEDVLNQVQTRLANLPDGNMADPLLSTSLTAEQWMQLKKINQILSEDYQCRRQMIIKRFQVTLESFTWGEKQKERSTVLASVPPLASLNGSSQVSLSLLLAARVDQSHINPIKAGTSTSIYKKLMGSVPDRGGRPGEIEPPMPAWEGRSTKGNKWGRGGRGGGHHRNKFSDKKKKKGKNE